MKFCTDSVMHKNFQKIQLWLSWRYTGPLHDISIVFRLSVGLTLFQMGGGGGGSDSVLLQIVLFITSVRDAAEPQNLVIFPKL